MNYSKIYDRLCERGKFRSKKENPGVEKHHIIPTFFFKNSKRKHKYRDGIFEGTGDEIHNISYLTPREHFLAHLLLCKIWSNTKWYHRCRSSLMLFYMTIDSKHPRNQHFNPSHSKKYEKYRLAAIQSISEMRKGTMPAKDSKTGEPVGSVPTTHPKVLSGEWVHHSKGKRVSYETRNNMSTAMAGYGNSTSVYSDEEIMLSYIKCCTSVGYLVSQTYWINYSKAHNLPFLTHFKKFRFDGNGFFDLVATAKNNHNLTFHSNSTRPFHSKEYKNFLQGDPIWQSRSKK